MMISRCGSRSATFVVRMRQRLFVVASRQRTAAANNLSANAAARNAAMSSSSSLLPSSTSSSPPLLVGIIANNSTTTIRQQQPHYDFCYLTTTPSSCCCRRHYFSTLNTAEEEAAAADTDPVVVDDDNEPGSVNNVTKTTRFQDLDDMHPISKATLDHHGFETMTEIQFKTWQAAISGQDVLGRSRTGSGKTLAFVLPALERILRQRQHYADENKLRNIENNQHVQMLIISPTRELAHQIYETTDMMIAKHNNKDDDDTGNSVANLTSQVIYGGVNKRQDLSRFNSQIPNILTATPGRLMDHLESTYVHDKPFYTYFQNIQVLVLDEMDRLLDMGFRDDIQQILQYVPNERQTLLFSATVPPTVREMIRQSISPNHTVVDCIQEEDPTTHTNKAITQTHVVLPPDRVIAGVVQLIQHLTDTNPDNHKLLVFFPTTSQVKYFSNLFNNVLRQPVMEIHSKKDQNNRTKTAAKFRHAVNGAVMFTSDVSARGVDYPDVTHVVQIGVASDRNTYIHRLGRTGRAGKKGEGIIVLTDAEQSVLTTDLQGLEIPVNSKLQELVDNHHGVEEDDVIMPWQQAVHSGGMADNKLERDAQAVYRSMFGFYCQRLKNLGVRGTGPLIELVNGFAKQAGLAELPGISVQLAKQFGVMGHPAVNIQSGWTGGGGRNNFHVGRGGRDMAGNRNHRSFDRRSSGHGRLHSPQRFQDSEDYWNMPGNNSHNRSFDRRSGHGRRPSRSSQRFQDSGDDWFGGRR